MIPFIDQASEPVDDAQDRRGNIQNYTSCYGYFIHRYLLRQSEHWNFEIKFDCWEMLFRALLNIFPPCPTKISPVIEQQHTNLSILRPNWWRYLNPGIKFPSTKQNPYTFKKIEAAT